MVRYLTAALAKQVDVDLMGRGAFSIDQLMELAGLSCASVVQHLYPKSTRVLVISGPGNNGGDGLVAARHLKHFQFQIVAVHYPKRTNQDLYKRLVQQCIDVNVQFDEELALKNYDLVLDAMFGFSFSGEIRAPFDSVINHVNSSNLPVVSVDIPSGWNVETGPQGSGLSNPTVLISLTAPKLCAQYIPVTTKHFVGGRFVPEWMDKEYELDLPKYAGSDQFVQVPAPERL